MFSFTGRNLSPYEAFPTKQQNLLDKHSPYRHPRHGSVVVSCLRPGEPKRNNTFLSYLEDHRMGHFQGERMQSVSLQIQFSPGTVCIIIRLL